MAEKSAPSLPSLPTSLPIADISHGSMWWRVHLSKHSPVFFGPRSGTPATNRFDAPNGEYRTLYVGESFSAAFVETLLRVPALPFVQRQDIEARSVSMLTNHSTLRLVDLRGGGLSKIGADNSLTTGPYNVAGLWALALWAHADRPDGILYRSRHNPSHGSAAIFHRGHDPFAVTTTVSLMDMAHRWAPLMRAHGKGIA